MRRADSAIDRGCDDADETMPPGALSQEDVPRDAAAPSARWLSFASRLLGAIRVDRATFREVADDDRAFPQAALLTAAGGITQNLGTAALWSLGDNPTGAQANATAAAAALVAWLIPTAMIWLVAGGGRADRKTLERLLRAAGFSAAPQLLYLLCLPLSTWLDQSAAAWTIAVGVWILGQAALFIAVQETLAATMLRTLVVFTLAGLLTIAAALAAVAFLPEAIWRPLLL